MINTDENALICDFAETYNIYDYRSLPVKTVAALSVGLRANSRIKMKINGQELQTEELLLSAIVDRLSMLVWMNTKDAQKGKNKPELLIKPKEDKDELIGFECGSDFEKVRERILRGEYYG